MCALAARVVAGAAAGVVAAAVLAPVHARQLAGVGALEVEAAGTGTALWIVTGAVPGAVIALLARPGPTPPAVPMARGLLVGVLWWAVWLLTAGPLLRGEAPSWDAAAVAAGFAEMIADGLQGTSAGLAWAVLSRGLPAPEHEAPPVTGLPRIVVLGGGFAGVAVVQRLERLARRAPRWDVTLVSKSNFLLFTPMLPEVAAGALHGRHVSAPLRAACPRTRFLHGDAEAVDLVARTVTVRAGDRPRELSWDHLVVAVGSQPTYRSLPGVEEHALALKTLADAQAVRTHVLARLDEADGTADRERRRALLTFAVVGAGFAGAEAVAELRDLVHSVLRFFPSLLADELRFVLVHSQDRILPELSLELARYAAQRLAERGVELRLSTRVAGARPGALLLDEGEAVPTWTIVWTAGNRPAAVVDALALEKERGAIAVDSTLRARGAERVWAAGDCAAVPDASGGRYPPTAQHALREGKTLADNLAAVLGGRPPAPFRFATLGMLAALGHRTGVAEIRGHRFSGALAWALWRGIYLAKLPGLEKRVRVALDWTLDLGFPRDIVLDAESAAPAQTDRESTTVPT
jgi:NADH:ubiquinone reductase (H+-translocating)